MCSCELQAMHENVKSFLTARLVLPLDILCYFPAEVRQENKCYLKVNNIKLNNGVYHECALLAIYLHSF